MGDSAINVWGKVATKHSLKAEKNKDNENEIQNGGRIWSAIFFIYVPW